MNERLTSEKKISAVSTSETCLPVKMSVSTTDPTVRQGNLFVEAQDGDSIGGVGFHKLHTVGGYYYIISECDHHHCALQRILATHRPRAQTRSSRDIQ